MILLFVGQSTMSAQQEEQMLIFQIDGNKYIKKNYDKDKKLINSQIYKMGEVAKKKGFYTMPLKVYTYDKNDKLKDSSEAKYICNLPAGEIFMNVFSITELKANKTVKIELGSSNKFYPNSWQTGLKIADISFTLKVEGGVLGAFGTNSKVRLYDRKITSYDTLNNTYSITGKMEVMAYMFGLRLDTIDSTIKESVHPQKGIIQQYLKESTGKYFTINLQ